MKSKLKIAMLMLLSIVLTLGVGAIFLVPYFYWSKLPQTPMNVWIIDKTVPVPDYREHKGLVWVLNHKKIVPLNGSGFFENHKDFFGFFPIDKDTYDIKPLPKVIENPDLIYITDTYGVYTDDYMIRNVKGTRSDIIYGGLEKEEINILKNNLGNKNTFIGEFNIASSPTNVTNRDELGKLFGVKWTGWKGRYFKDLTKDIEVPVWMVENYEKQYNQKWTFSGEGFALVSDEDEIVILEKNKDIGKKNIWINLTNKYSEEFEINGDIPYYYWFEFIQPEPDKEILANYTIDVTKAGEEKLKKIGLTSQFPAMVRFSNQQYTSYYFAGDFADMQNIGNTWKFYGLDKLRKNITLDSKGSQNYFYWKCYVPLMSKIVEDIKKNKQRLKDKEVKTDTVSINAKAFGSGFQILDKGQWRDFFVKGVNIGAAIPGKWFTEFPRDYDTYLKWFDLIGKMNANTLRIYTLLPPEFYKALDYYNKHHVDQPLWLLQEFWPEEEPKDKNYLGKEYQKEYEKEIEQDIDAIHGMGKIDERKGRAYGMYTSDVSKYVLGYLVGREIEAEEVIATNDKNKGFKFEGEYLTTGATATPIEGWLAMNANYVLKYEQEKYNSQHPVAIVSWPTLDPVQHDAEWNVNNDKSKEFNDSAILNINNIDTGEKMKAGFFGAYHIYPNYPDFMNNELKYHLAKDNEGRFLYQGYLNEFIAGHKKYPALVAEFGISTGMGNAHSNPDGYNHGGLNEVEQGNGIVRMLKAIKSEGYAGGLIFEWIDEWAKKTWTTEPFMIPYERHVLWHNKVDPEQNYGILTYEAIKPEKINYSISGKGLIKNVDLSVNEAFLYIDVDLKRAVDFSKESILLGIDTYDRKRGEFNLSSNNKEMLPFGLEYKIEITKKGDAKLLVIKDYNSSKGKYSSFASNTGIFEEISALINSARVRKDGSKVNPVYEEGSKLIFGEFKDISNSSWTLSEKTLQVRIPWGRINFSDPSKMFVIDDKRQINVPTRDEINTTISDGIMVYAAISDTQKKELIDKVYSKEPYKWDDWKLPAVTERLKKSYDIIKGYFSTLK